MPNFSYLGQRIEFVGEYAGSYDCLNRGAFYEQTFLEHVRSLGLGGTYLDVGTNIGNHAVYFAKFCAAESVIGFEPIEYFRARAAQNIAANGCQDKVSIQPFGLADRLEERTFRGNGRDYRIQCTTLDRILPDLRDVTVVKMDIEGGEPCAILGGARFFSRNRPVIFAEVLTDRDELDAAMQAVGYRASGNTFPACHLHEFVPA